VVEYLNYTNLGKYKLTKLLYLIIIRVTRTLKVMIEYVYFK